MPGKEDDNKKTMEMYTLVFLLLLTYFFYYAWGIHLHHFGGGGGGASASASVRHILFDVQPHTHWTQWIHFFSAVCLSEEAEAAAVADNSAEKMLLNCERQKTVAVCLCERLSNTKDGKSKFSLVCSDDGGFYCRGGTKKKKHDFGPVLFCFGFCHSPPLLLFA